MLQENVDVLILVQGLISNRRPGPYRIATELRKAGYSCQVIEAAWYFDEKEIEKILKFCIGPNTKLVGYSTQYDFRHFLNQNFLDVTETLPVYPILELVHKTVKEINSKVKIVVGGTSWYHMSTSPYVDILITGMGDRAIIECVSWLENKNPFFQYTVNEAGKVVINGNKLNTAWSFSSSEIEYIPADNIFPGESLTIEISRGCIFQCDFCSYHLNGKKSNEYIKYKEVLHTELTRNYEQYGITKYIFSDDTYNDNIVKLQAVAEVVQSLPFELQSSTYLRIDLLRAHPEQYSLLRDVGLVGTVFGIESLNYETARNIGKGLRPERVVEELERVRVELPAVGVNGCFIAGLPYETKDSLLTWMEQIAKPDFPLDYVFVGKLNIMPTEWSSSKFSQDSSKYYVTDPARSGWWHNGEFDQLWAAKQIKDFDRKLRQSKRQRIAGFATTAYQNYGYDKSIIKKPRADIDLGPALSDIRFQKYKTMLFENISSI